MKRRLCTWILMICMLLALAPSNSAYAEELPKKYRSTSVTPAEDQGNTNLCWAFSTVSAMETELIQNNGADPTLDFSEIQIGCFRFNSAMDPLGQQHMMFSGKHDVLNGGRNFVVGALMGTGLSPIEESLVPVDFVDVTNDTRLDESLAYTGKYYMKEFRMMKVPERDAVKKAIMTYGSVVTDFFTDESYYNAETSAWYNVEARSINHMVCIVGWDDTYSKKNFKNIPAGDGAWIVKNSWGEDWGDNGFFYVSYYDASFLHERAEYAIYDMEPGKYADNLYQNAFQVTSYLGNKPNGETDWLNNHNGCSYEKVANIFTAQANENGGEELTGVSLYTFQTADYVIKIYKNVRDNNNPESGTLVATLKGKFDAPGFRIIPLEKAIYLSEGESYSVVASLKTAKGEYCGVAKSDASQTDMTPTYGQSYIYREYEKQWEDLAVWSGTNLYLNAYTDNVEANALEDAKKVTMKKSCPASDGRFTMPADVTGVKLDYADSTTAIVSWEKAVDTEYIIYQYNKVADTWKKYDFVESGKGYYVIRDLTPGSTYTFGVTAATRRKETSRTYMQSANCTGVEVKTRTTIQTEPKLSQTEEGNVLTWEAVPEATFYEVYCMSPATDYEWRSCTFVLQGNELKYTDKNVVNGLTYSYRVYAYKGAGLLSKGTPVTAVCE